MAYEVIWSPLAIFDLKDISSYISESNPATASYFIQQVFRAVERLQSFPLSGRVVPEFDNPCIREIIRKPCRIIYRIEYQTPTIEIVRVWHAARGVPEI